MLRLAEWKIEHRDAERRIELLRGDLASLPAEHTVDVLVVSAFPGDYTPTPGSLIGALQRNGISVARLALSKQKDMREEFSCWLSEPLIGNQGFRRILCIESGWRGTPPEIADDLFRAIAPCSVSEFPKRSVAMPLIGAEQQRFAPDGMLESILRAAVAWFRRGLPIAVLKIVAYSDAEATLAKEKFVEIQRADAANQREQLESPDTGSGDDRDAAAGTAFDVFLSYAHKDAKPAEDIRAALEGFSPGIRIFYDKTALSPGASWLMKIAEALDASRRVVPIYTPAYWASNYCKDEFSAAYVRQSDRGARILHPIYLREASIPYLFKNIQWDDCRPGDAPDRITAACERICAGLLSSRH